MELGEKIKSLRREKGWTQKELAEKAGVGVATIQNYEKKTTGETVLQKTIGKIAAALGVTPENLLLSDTVIATVGYAHQSNPEILDEKSMGESGLQKTRAKTERIINPEYSKRIKENPELLRGHLKDRIDKMSAEELITADIILSTLGNEDDA